MTTTAMNMIHEQGADHDEPHDHGLEHSHGGRPHSHAPAPGSTITWRGLFVLGLAGGLIPSTSALLILLGSIAAGRPGFGFVLVVAFGLGMAAVMGGIGLVIVAARRRLDRHAGRSGAGSHPRGRSAGRGPARVRLRHLPHGSGRRRRSSPLKYVIRPTIAGRTLC